MASKKENRFLLDDITQKITKKLMFLVIKKQNSSLHEISKDQLGNSAVVMGEEGVTSSVPTPLYSRLLDQ